MEPHYLEVRIQEQCQHLMSMERVPHGGDCPGLSQQQTEGKAPGGNSGKVILQRWQGAEYRRWKKGQLEARTGLLALEGHWAAVCPVGISVDTHAGSLVLDSKLLCRLRSWAAE